VVLDNEVPKDSMALQVLKENQASLASQETQVAQETQACQVYQVFLEEKEKRVPLEQVPQGLKVIPDFLVLMAFQVSLDARVSLDSLEYLVPPDAKALTVVLVGQVLLDLLDWMVCVESLASQAWMDYQDNQAPRVRWA